MRILRKLRPHHLACGLLLIALGAPAAEPTPPPAPPKEEEKSSERPEYRARAMPQDTFKPSEKVPEDYPIAFPADI